MKPAEALVVVERAAPAVTEPAAQALVPWGVELVDGQIVLGGMAIHPVMARDLWLRLGSLLGEAARDAEQAAWSRLSDDLDRHFAGARPARGRTIGSPASEVRGVLLRESETAAVFRIATFSIVLLQRAGGLWEGPVVSLRPSSLGAPERSPIGVRVRVAGDAVGPTRLTLAGPSAPSSPPARPTTAPSRPATPEWLTARWTAIRADLAELLALLPEVGATASLDELARRLRWPRARIRARLEALVERGDLEELKAPGAAHIWRRRWLDPPARPVFDDKPKHRTRLVKAPTSKTPKAPKPAPASSSPKRRGKPVPVQETRLRCAPCDRTVPVAVGVTIPPDPRCRVCGGPLERLVDGGTR